LIVPGYVVIGSYNLKDGNEIGRTLIDVKDYFVHPDWNQNIPSYDADIAVLTLQKSIEFNEYIQPICLMEPDSKALKVKKGVVVGYGRSETASRHEHIARKIDYPIHDFATCMHSDPILAKMVSSRTICGGYKNGTGTCSGDSGSGLYVLYNNLYYLRGIVSSSAMGGHELCDLEKYTVLTDVSNFYSFISTGNLDVLTPSNEKLEQIIKSKFIPRI